jgi:hypothetical protein
VGRQVTRAMFWIQVAAVQIEVNLAQHIARCIALLFGDVHMDVRTPSSLVASLASGAIP